MWDREEGGGNDSIKILLERKIVLKVMDRIYVEFVFYLIIISLVFI